MGTNSKILFNLGGVLDISLETSALTSDYLPLSILTILVFNSSLFLLNGGIKKLKKKNSFELGSTTSLALVNFLTSILNSTSYSSKLLILST